MLDYWRSWRNVCLTGNLTPPWLICHQFPVCASGLQLKTILGFPMKRRDEDFLKLIRIALSRSSRQRVGYRILPLPHPLTCHLCPRSDGPGPLAGLGPHRGGRHVRTPPLGLKAVGRIRRDQSAAVTSLPAGPPSPSHPSRGRPVVCEVGGTSEKLWSIFSTSITSSEMRDLKPNEELDLVCSV